MKINEIQLSDIRTSLTRRAQEVLNGLTDGEIRYLDSLLGEFESLARLSDYIVFGAIDDLEGAGYRDPDGEPTRPYQLIIGDKVLDACCREEAIEVLKSEYFDLTHVSDEEYNEELVDSVDRLIDRVKMYTYDEKTTDFVVFRA